MRLGSWTWIQLAVVVVAYWAVVLAAWQFHVTRPAHQARARAAATVQRRPGSRPGEEVVTFSSTISLTPLLPWLAGPPLLLILLRWAL